MRIKVKPCQFAFPDPTPTGTVFMVSVVGRAPHKTFFVEENIGVVQDPADAPKLVGQHIVQELKVAAGKKLIEQGANPAEVQALYDADELPVQIPVIPGVTTEGEWRNPPFSQRKRGPLADPNKPVGSRVSA